MPKVVIKIFGAEATCEHYEWTSEDAQVAEMLNRLRHRHGPSGNDPDPNLTLAQKALELFGVGEIIHHEPYKRPEGDLIY